MFPELKFFLMSIGTVLSADVHVMDRLKKRLRLREVKSEDESDVIIAFVPIVSRAGTDIDAALKQIPQSFRPVVLVVLHHTFDSEFVPTNSRQWVTRENVFTVDCLFHEDKEFLRCQRNDIALKAVTEHLNTICKRTSDQLLLLPKGNSEATDTCCTCSKRCLKWTIILIFTVECIAVIVVAILCRLGVIKL